MKRQGLRQGLATALMSNKDTDIQEWMDKYLGFNEHVLSQDEDDGSVHIGVSVESLLMQHNPEHLIPILPKSLNERIGGGLPKPCHVLIYARPESGKTATCINLSCGIINQGRRVLYIGNEEAYSSMLLRFISRLSGMTVSEVRGNPVEADRLANERGYGNLVYAPLSPGSVKEIRELVEKYQPDALVIDQLHNLSHKNDNKVEKLEALAKEIRDLSNEYNIAAVSVTQAGESAEGKLLLTMDDVYYSNTGIPGHVDLMIGVGKDDNADRENYRFLSVSKNKFNGDHNPLKVRIVPALSKVLSNETN